ncbi:MAG: aspartate/glutamate racemase family protein [Bryobacteraceae bacterium]|nr:aspartate/glutamate racemase family protein [Bryobacteraceae bacterium]
MHLALIHTSPAAITPLARYYAEHEPEWRLTHLLDDGILHLFRESRESDIEAALASLVERAAGYGARAAIVTCSAVTPALLSRLQMRSPMPLIKIDEPMARAAVSQARRIGVLISFPPTLQPTVSLLEDTAASLGRRVEIVPQVCDGAYAALLAGDTATHDRILHSGARQLTAQSAEAIVLAQVSMAHLRDELAEALSLPVFSSLETSHAAVREALGL